MKKGEIIRFISDHRNVILVDDGLHRFSLFAETSPKKNQILNKIFKQSKVHCCDNPNQYSSVGKIVERVYNQQASATV